VKTATQPAPIQTSKSPDPRANEAIRANETVLHGQDCLALAEGKDPIAVAAGDGCRAKVNAKDDSHMACAVAAGTGCEAEATGDGVIAVVAVGVAPTAISNNGAAECVAIGYEPFAQATDEAGTAISIGYDPSAQAEEGGYLVFVDTTEREPKVAVFAVDPDKGIWPNIPYRWQSGWAMPCPDSERMDRDGFERGKKFQREHPEEK
jgi:hypothetical protein